MEKIDYTLVSDGSSDRMLMPLLRWLLRENFPQIPINGDWADLSRLINPPKTLAEKVFEAIKLYPCDVLFIHRDAERESWDVRDAEIEEAIREVSLRIAQSNNYSLPIKVCVIPTRMTESWYLFNLRAIRYAASNPNGANILALPRLQDIENLPNPKSVLYDLLKEASELTGRRGRKFKPERAVHQLAEYIDDFSPLDQLPSFSRLRSAIARIQNVNLS